MSHLVRLVAPLALVAFTLAAADAHAADAPTAPAAAPAPAATPTPPAADAKAGGEVIKRGAPLGTSPKVELATLMSKASDYAGKSVRVDAVAAKVCSRKGCWMELSDGKGGQGMRVTFKDYGFFVPLDAAGSKVAAEGTVKVKVLPKEVADHYASEGAKVVRNPDGTANELTMVASGVELTR